MRYYGKYDMFTFFRAYLRNRTFRFQYAFRMCQCSGIKRVIGLFLWEINRTKRIMQIPRETKVGYGLYIGHGGPVIINPTTIIGNNCNLSQFTTIGSNEGQAAVIGDNVYIGPSVCIVENVTIGAGSIVVKDIPDNATVVGNYARVINYDNPGRYINKRWKM